MVIVGGTFEIDPDQREQFLAGRAAMMRRSRAEHGCLEYSFCADPLEPARVVLFERWSSQADRRTSRCPAGGATGERSGHQTDLLVDHDLRRHRRAPARSMSTWATSIRT